MKWRENTHQVDPEQPGTTTTTTTPHTKLSEHEWRSFSPQHKNTTQENPAPSSSLGGNKARMRTETFNGAIVSGTWPHPDAYYTTKPLEVCQPHLYIHTHTHRHVCTQTDSGGQHWCYSGAILNFIRAALGKIS